MRAHHWCVDSHSWSLRWIANLIAISGAKCVALVWLDVFNAPHRLFGVRRCVHISPPPSRLIATWGHIDRLCGTIDDTTPEKTGNHLLIGRGAITPLFACFRSMDISDGVLPSVE